MLGLTPEEKQRAEEALRGYSQAVSQLAATRAYETNSLPPAVATRWADHPYKSVWVPPLGTDIQPLMDNLLAQGRDALGDERAQLLLGDVVAGKTDYSRWSAAFARLSKGTLFTICVNPDGPDGVECAQYQNGSGGGGSNGNRHEVNLYSLPEAISSQFFDPWLAQMGITNTASRANL